MFEPKWSAFLADTEEQHYKTMSINAEHPIKLTRIAMRSLLGANKPGVVLLVGSMAGIRGSYTAPLYCATKHAVAGFTKSMAQADKDENVKVICCCPGMVDTPLWTGDEAKDVADQHSFTTDVCVSAEEVAKAMIEMGMFMHWRNEEVDLADLCALTVQEEKYPGGALVEVSKTNLRGQLESGLAHRPDNPVMAAWIEKSAGPIREVFRKERNAGL